MVMSEICGLTLLIDVDLDENKNGLVSRDELFKGLCALYGPSCAKFESNRVFRTAATNEDGDGRSAATTPT